MQATDKEAPVSLERRGLHIAVVTLNRPAAHNAIDGAMTLLLAKHLDEIEADKDLRVAILAAAGEKSFCAGADLNEVAAGRGHALTTPEGGFAGFVDAPRLKPWIAAVRGFALGGGLELSLACDMIIAGERAAFGLPEPKRGIIAGAGGVYRLPRAIPRAVALEMLSAGTRIDARRAYELGLVNRVVADDAVLAEAVILAEQIAANAPLSVRESLAIGRIAGERTEEELRRLTGEAMGRILESEDAREGPRAFVEKRPPRWQS